MLKAARLESVYAGNRIAGSNPAPSASYYVLDIAYIIVFPGSLFSREFAGVTGLVFKAIRGRDGFTRDLGCGRYENLSGALSWLTFSRAEKRTPGELKAIARGAKAGARNFTRRWIGDLVSAKAEELSLFSPVSRQPRRQNQLHIHVAWHRP
jgi:hypothetical protein